MTGLLQVLVRQFSYPVPLMTHTAVSDKR